MNPNQTPKPTGSILQNSRLYRAARVARLDNPEGLRLAGRRSALPPARRTEVMMAITGSLLIFFLLMLLTIG
ncbi:hypothetical protein [Neolewinella litorea]|uniref:Uncharacterized protein n=1 Tax=Neolewinella litorea TaxID=2562452 RepID=A0A4S4NQM9_9BACT|nr:hypothetical protein [Neolewinella litorea]THH41455.1 hypothetical protein E4021_02325 [Neolewinella litorea]